MPDTATLQTWLTEAETALHKLETGAASVKIDYDGNTVEYTRTSTGGLRRYIRDLKRQLGQSSGRQSRPVLFG